MRRADTVLKVVTAKLSANIRQGDFVVRQGGEEFVILLRQCELAPAAEAGRGDPPGDRGDAHRSRLRLDGGHSVVRSWPAGPRPRGSRDALYLADQAHLPGQAARPQLRADRPGGRSAGRQGRVGYVGTSAQSERRRCRARTPTTPDRKHSTQATKTAPSTTEIQPPIEARLELHRGGRSRRRRAGRTASPCRRSAPSARRRPTSSNGRRSARASWNTIAFVAPARPVRAADSTKTARR